MTLQECTLGDVLDFFNGKAPSKTQSGIYPVFGSNGQIGWSDKFNHEQAVIIGRVGSCGSIKVYRGKFWASDNTIVVKPKQDNDLNYLYYKLSSMPLSGYAGGAAQPLLTQGVLKSVKSLFADPETQIEISQILKRYDDLIENNKRRIELLEESARQLYKEWFVRFRFPGHEHVKVIDGVPEGWERCTASQALIINPKVTVEKGKEILYVPMACLSESQMTVDASKFERREKHTTVKFQQGDTLFARITPCLENGKTAYVNFLDEGEIACGSTEFIVLRGYKVSNQFAYLLAREESFRGNAIKSMIGSSGRQRVQSSCFDKYIVSVAPSTIQEQFDEVVELAFKESLINTGFVMDFL